MRISALFLRLAVFALAAALSVMAARATVSVVEDRSVVAVQEALVDNGHSWVSVIGDGLQVILEGPAPSEADLFRAISTAGAFVDASRVINNMTIAESETAAPPPFEVEILRNDRGVSLIGLIPAATDRENLTDRIANIADDLPVTDLLEAADYPAPPAWNRSMTFALRALAQLPRSKLSVLSGKVRVEAIADSIEEKNRLDLALSRNLPQDVSIELFITAPRPVVSPYLMRFTSNDEGVRFSACTVSDPEGRNRVIAAARAIGFSGITNCVEALGSPSRRWVDANELALAALGELGGGTVIISNTDVTITALQGTSQGTFDSVVGALQNALPPAFALTANLPVTPEAGAEGPPQFVATLSPEGQVQLRGRISNAQMNSTAQNFAMAKFGQANITMGTRIVDGLPSGWAVRVLAGIEALSDLSNGAVTIEPDLITVRGKTGSLTASADITAMILDRVGDNTDMNIDVEYVEQLDPVAGLPTPEECISRIETVTADRKILFDPGSADISAESQTVIDDIAEILQRCPDLRIRIAGYTDSQGREEMNLRLSEDRARAVLAALRLRRVPVSTFEAEGFGEENPIADNETEAGRDANRRIEFSLIVPEAVAEQPTALEQLEADAAADDASQTEGTADDTQDSE